MHWLWHSSSQLAMHRLVAAAVLLCSAVFRAPAQAPVTSADSMALTLAIYNVAFTNGTHTAHAAVLPDLVCVQGMVAKTDPPPYVIDSLQANRTLLLRPMSACRVEPLTMSIPFSSTSLVVDTLTGKRGISISASKLAFLPDGTFTVSTGYYQHGLSSAAWTCTGRHTDQGWTITSCRMLWIS